MCIETADELSHLFVESVDHFLAVFVIILEIILKHFGLLFVDVVLSSSLVNLFHIDLSLLAVQETAVSGEAFVNESHVVGLHFVEDGVQNAFWWLPLSVSKWDRLFGIMEVVDVLVNIAALFDQLQLGLPNILLQGQWDFFWCLEFGASREGDGDT